MAKEWRYIPFYAKKKPCLFIGPSSISPPKIVLKNIKLKKLEQAMITLHEIAVFNSLYGFFLCIILLLIIWAWDNIIVKRQVIY